MSIYRVEYKIVENDDGDFGKKEFEADSDETASVKVAEVCQYVQNMINRTRTNRFWHCRVHPTRLVRIEQPEISHEIALSVQAKVA